MSGNKQKKRGLWQSLRAGCIDIALPELDAARLHRLGVIVFLTLALIAIAVLMCLTSDRNSIPIGFRSYLSAVQLSADGDNPAFAEYDDSTVLAAFIKGEEYIFTESADEFSTVGELLSSCGFFPDEDDYVNYPLDEPLDEFMIIVADEVSYELAELVETTPFETIVTGVQDIPRGERVITQSGADGVKQLSVRNRYVNGSYDSREILAETVIAEYRDELVNEGTGGIFTAPDGTEYSYSYCLDVVATAYSELSGITYTGKRIQLGMIAVDPKVIALGSRVYVIGDYGDYGVCYAEDTGANIKGKRIDMFLGNDLQVLLNFGRRNMKVYILD